jgi:hypothetical protein
MHAAASGCGDRGCERVSVDAAPAPGRRHRQQALIGELVNTGLAFLCDHQDWAVPIVFLLAFGEPLAFVSLLLPAIGTLVEAGGLIGAAGLSF